MTLDEAKDVNGRLVSAGLWNLGLPNRGEYPDLQAYSLEQMIQATRLVQGANDEQDKKPGNHTFSTVCDDRLIAALFVHTHFAVCQQGEDGIESIVSDGKKALVCMKVVEAT